LLFVDTRAPSNSALLAKAAGQAHGGGMVWPQGGTAADRVTAWIASGARLDAGTRAPAEAPVAPPPASPRPVRSSPSPSGGPAAPPPEPPVAPLPRVGAPSASAPDGAPPRSPVHALLMTKCASCHRAGLPAGVTAFVLTGDADADLALAASFVARESLATSPLLTKATGALHGGGAVLPSDGGEYQRLLAWASALGPETAIADASASAPAAEVARSVPPAPGAMPASRGPPLTPVAVAASVSPVGRQGVGLPYGFQLNGRFDLNYERRTFSTDPTAAGATNALRSYHHFLFLSRQSPEERIGLSVELLGLLFWEANLRFRPHDAWQVVVAAGKIVVPFGADPLTHQSYGGLAGFDQRLLPALWASEGAAAHLVAHRGQLAFTDDLYVIRGYALRRSDGVLSLRSDLSPDDDARLAVGTRAGLSWGPVAIWYSALFNPLGYGRRLFMQAADVTLWRARQWPVLRYLSVGAGLMRGDVSGGGAGDDYYHFGGYLQVRVHPREWLYLQYRQGVTTFDNRRGTFVDRSRLTSEDASAHNFGVVARRGGLGAGLFWFVNLEAVEIANDLLRAVVTYEF
jgi:hypothetical protein